MTGFPPSVSHLRVCGCAVYVPISPHYRRKLGPQRRLEIYVGFNSPSVIRYLEPTTDDLFTTRFADCQFDESTFSILGEDNWKRETSGKVDQIVMFNWPKDKPVPPDPYTREGEKEVQRILHVQSIANNAPDAFVDTFNMKVSDINPAMNVPARILIGESPAHVVES